MRCTLLLLRQLSWELPLTSMHKTRHCKNAGHGIATYALAAFGIDLLLMTERTCGYARQYHAPKDTLAITLTPHGEPCREARPLAEAGK